MNAPFETLRPLVLASSSPRRQAFFQEQGLVFTPILPVLDEPIPAPGEEPAAYALRTAEAKAREALETWGRSPDKRNDLPPVVVAADTVVVLEDRDGSASGRIMGKPGSPAEALTMLKALSGRGHAVITACCLLPADGEALSFADRAEVRFAPWPESALAAYVATGEPMDKAGAYGIQGIGAFLAERVEGSWTTVVGLPLHLVLQGLIRLGAIRPRPTLST